jgi:hypothetical protein
MRAMKVAYDELVRETRSSLTGGPESFLHPKRNLWSTQADLKKRSVHQTSFCNCRPLLRQHLIH